MLDALQMESGLRFEFSDFLYWKCKKGQGTRSSSVEMFKDLKYCVDVWLLVKVPIFPVIAKISYTFFFAQISLDRYKCPKCIKMSTLHRFFP